MFALTGGLFRHKYARRDNTIFVTEHPANLSLADLAKIKKEPDENSWNVDMPMSSMTIWVTVLLPSYL